ncbi:uncharacterized protein PV09_05164 [Verruconis gallopava]|uniref:Uncharacterized protein n=1 Tax=Verruconis gallopava TaxID=253628 RepID=A0A0D1YTA1_9PEZI|nr:uncharacterized protein PV09_05164 [Verruconis gallopava]KIW03867.1 hypothetical protein PV09_05164 [Verruconis gallopava]
MEATSQAFHPTAPILTISSQASAIRSGKSFRGTLRTFQGMLVKYNSANLPQQWISQCIERGLNAKRSSASFKTESPCSLHRVIHVSGSTRPKPLKILQNIERFNHA